MNSWDEVVAFACALPDVEMASFYGKLCPKVRGKAFVSPGREHDSFHVMSPHAGKAVLLETDPDTFWQTPHYEGWPGLLIRYGSSDPERVQCVVARLVGPREQGPTGGVRGTTMKPSSSSSFPRKRESSRLAKDELGPCFRGDDEGC